MKNNLSTIDFICLSIVLGGLLFFLDVWLTRLYDENVSSTKQVPVQMEMKESK
jgi:hypothetical protein